MFRSLAPLIADPASSASFEKLLLDQIGASQDESHKMPALLLMFFVRVGLVKNLTGKQSQNTPVANTIELEGSKTPTDFPIAEFTDILIGSVLANQAVEPGLNWFTKSYFNILEKAAPRLREEDLGNFWDTLAKLGQVSIELLKKSPEAKNLILAGLVKVMFHGKIDRKTEPNHHKSGNWYQTRDRLIEAVKNSRGKTVDDDTKTDILRFSLFLLEAQCLQLTKGDPAREALFWNEFSVIHQKLTTAGLLQTSSEDSKDPYSVQRSGLVACCMVLCIGDSKTYSAASLTEAHFEQYKNSLKSGFMLDDFPTDAHALEHYSAAFKDYPHASRFHLALLPFDDSIDSRYLKGLAKTVSWFASQEWTEPIQEQKTWLCQVVQKLHRNLVIERKRDSPQRRVLLTHSIRNLLCVWSNLYFASEFINHIPELLWWKQAQNFQLIEAIISDQAFYQLLEQSYAITELKLLVKTFTKLSFVFSDSFHGFSEGNVKAIWNFAIKLHNLLLDKQKPEQNGLEKSYLLSGFFRIIKLRYSKNTSATPERVAARETVTKLADADIISAGSTKESILKIISDGSAPSPDLSKITAPTTQPVKISGPGQIKNPFAN